METKNDMYRKGLSRREAVIALSARRSGEPIDDAVLRAVSGRKDAKKDAPNFNGLGRYGKRG